MASRTTTDFHKHLTDWLTKVLLGTPTVSNCMNIFCHLDINSLNLSSRLNVRLLMSASSHLSVENVPTLFSNFFFETFPKIWVKIIAYSNIKGSGQKERKKWVKIHTLAWPPLVCEMAIFSFFLYHTPWEQCFSLEKIFFQLKKWKYFLKILRAREFF